MTRSPTRSQMNSKLLPRAAAAALFAVSAVSQDLVAVKGGTQLRFTEHTAFLDGKDASEDRRRGSLELLEALARELDLHN